MIREVCCAHLDAVRSAASRGADRVELCSALEVGGVTPSFGLVREALNYGVPVNVLIRPRSGDFVYSPEEVNAMCRDIRELLLLGANGVVVGTLTADGGIDKDACGKMVDVVASLTPLLHRKAELTFHRAFDVCKAPFEALEEIIALGFDRILTSGQATTAPEGVDLLRRLVTRSNGRISIMAGCGVTPDNVDALVRQTGVQEVHGSRL